MSIQLKPISEQVIFITGATSDIGISTVRLAVDLGAKVFMVDSNEDELLRIQTEMRLKNLPTAYAVASVAEIDQIQIAADHCLETFGRIDTWINNADLSFYGKLLDITELEAKQIFDTNFWGVVNGCRMASDLMRRDGGVIINIGSAVPEISLPIQGMYAASKHAVKSYTDSLRSELSAELVPVSVSFVNPASLGLTESSERILPGPTYHPDLVANMILKCAVSEIKEIKLDTPSAFHSFIANILPSIKESFTSRSLGSIQNGNIENNAREVTLINKVPVKKWAQTGLIAGGIALLFFSRKKYV